MRPRWGAGRPARGSTTPSKMCVETRPLGHHSLKCLTGHSRFNCSTRTRGETALLQHLGEIRGHSRIRFSINGEHVRLTDGRVLLDRASAKILMRITNGNEETGRALMRFMVASAKVSSS